MKSKYQAHRPRRVRLDPLLVMYGVGLAGLTWLGLVAILSGAR